MYKNPPFLNQFIVGVQKATGLCNLILYSATLLKMFIVSRSSWVEFSASLSYKIMLSAKRDTLTTFFNLFVFLLFLLVVLLL
jgi:hypothetical protein